MMLLPYHISSGEWEMEITTFLLINALIQNSLRVLGHICTSLERYFWREYNAIDIVGNGLVVTEKIQEQGW